MVKKKIICIIQARIGSKRLPGKILKKINKRFNFIEFLIQRILISKKISNIVVAYPDSKKNKKIFNSLKKENIQFFKGSEQNVLQRYFKAAKCYKADIIVRITSDCPFSDPKLIDKFLKIFLKKNYDYYSNVSKRTYPDGFDIEIFNFKTLELANKKAFSKYDKEHVTPYMIKSKKIIKGVNVLSKDYSSFRVTLDTKEDLLKLRAIAKNLNPKNIFHGKISYLRLKELINKIIYEK